MQRTLGGYGGNVVDRISTLEVSGPSIQRLDEELTSSRTTDDRRGSGFATSHDEGGETEGDQDGEEGMDEGEQHDNEVDGADVEEHVQERGALPEPMAIGEGGEQESDMELDLLAESESDSDDQSNMNDAASSGAQRSIQTHATAGSDTAGGVANLALFSEDDSDESTQQVNF